MARSTGSEGGRRAPDRRRRRSGGPRQQLARLAAVLFGAAVLGFAVEGGEYGTSDLLRQRARKQRLQASIDSLAREVDSLSRYRRALLTDRALQERIAREEFGMVRGDREILYRFADPEPADSVATDRPWWRRRRG